ncbi:MAG: hypothetical protein FWB86_09675 [Treponema sp.]|nr:hypothetical protein [Treponema sp.]MCL2251923.1 hypothetical protein [Treponema sp.]
MLKREDFIFTIGYDGPSAVIDGTAKKLYAKLSTKELAEKGLFKAAYSSAIWSKDSGELELVAQIYNKTSGSSVSVSSLERLFGVFSVNDVKRSIIL